MYLEKEIKEQPDVLKRILQYESENISEIASELKRAGVCGFYIVARGSSDNAARYASYLFGARNRIVTALATPSLFTVYRSPVNLKGFAVIAISQSGESPDIISVTKSAKKQKVLTISLTNNPTSPLAKTSDLTINIRAGVERSVAATKTYTAQLFCLALLSHFMDPTKRSEKELSRIPQIVESVLAQEEDIEKISRQYRAVDRCVVLGRGFNYATSFELALKLKELCYVHAEPYSPVDFMHGPIAILDAGFLVILIAPKGRVNSGLFQLLNELKKRRAEILSISDDARINAMAKRKIELARSSPEWLSPISSIVAGQLFCLHLAIAKGLRPDRPRGLKKITKTF